MTDHLMQALAPPFAVESTPERDRVIVAVAGELDIATTGRVEDEVTGLYDRGFEKVVLDLSNVSFMDSSGLRLLIRLDDRARGDRRFTVVQGDGAARRLLALTRLDARFVRPLS
ncbi:MAG TPA: STAS domain-containing protein [Conexibacter sp.]|jgi:anti-sigma B factor antagonist